MEPFNKKRHDRSSFCCGIELLDRYLHEQADQDRKRKIAAPFVLIEEDQLDVLGYYTLSAFSIHLEELPPDLTKRLPRYPDVPATLLGRLAVDQMHQGKGLGELLLMDALHRSLSQTAKVASFAIVVDAINENARNFYLHFGFQLFPDRSDRLFLPMKTIEQLYARGQS
ncbi:MAG: GNAT family N-acetyltransferase [Candidatus Fraserbacteria bacterium RBG_16_55_9]|uniref:GNAT family N-acetyltransferase n=1 Tax=Fraserbacteria sp. (strain RBG_16_55_9) TaxID=1817864 RepID=A0A1F5UVM6_FRAXR|nr:MAG: GNAT family N-acetyltransferase [Candidatus Fraserbacteria bacterium RBG_16_55_9]